MKIIYLGAEVPSNRVILEETTANHVGVSYYRLVQRGLPKTKEYLLENYFNKDFYIYVSPGLPKTLKLGPNGENRMDDVAVFVESFAPAPRMIIFGAIDFAAAVARIGKFMGYYVIVCDARELFATKRRFPDADEVIIDWPHRYLPKVEVDESTVICVLTHDPKFDVPAIQGALATRAGYIGVMGSRKTHAKRLERMAEVGITSAADLARVHSPIGLDLGGRTPEETAISIVGEIIATRTGRQASPLSSSDGAIH